MESRKPPFSFRTALERAREILSSSQRLREASLVEPEAEQLALAAYKKATGTPMSRLDFYATPGAEFPGNAFVLLEAWCKERAAGKILQHLTGVQTFLGHEYEVGPQVLVPRPETEFLVLEACKVLKSFNPENRKFGIEIGIGSGAISIELLASFPEMSILASEVSADAEATAVRNANKILGAEWRKRLAIQRAPNAMDVLGAFRVLNGKKADFLISNPPYLSGEDEVDADVLTGEPREALFPGANPGADALYFYREIAAKADQYVRPDGWMFFEISHDRAQATAALFTSRGWAARLVKDLTGRERVLEVHLAAEAFRGK